MLKYGNLLFENWFIKYVGIKIFSWEDEKISPVRFLNLNLIFIWMKLIYKI